MPVEDIDFLYQNSTQENIVMLIDTSKRDMSIYPNVGEFQITFDEPFTNVYGIEILDTTIPRTMFMVETGINDSLIYRIGSTEYTVYLHTQDFTHSDQLFNILQYVFNKQSHFEDYPMDVSNNDIYYRQEIQVDEYYDRTKADFPLLTFRMDHPFLFDMTKSLLFDTIGFNCIPTSKHSDKYNTIHSLLNTRTNISKVDRSATDHGGAPIYTNVAEPTETVDNFIYTHDSIIMESFLVNICDSGGEQIPCIIKWIDDEGVLSEYIFPNGIINLILIKNRKYTIITTDAVVPPHVSIKYCEFFDVSEFYKNRIFLSKANIDYDDIDIDIHRNTGNTDYLEVTTIDSPRVTTIDQDLEDSDRKFNIKVDDVDFYYPGFTVKKLTITLLNYTSGKTFVLKVFRNNLFLMEVILKRNVLTSLLEYNNMDTTHFNTFFWDQYTYTFQLFETNREILYSDVIEFKVTGSFVGNYSLTAPGIINLAAENYIIMRCDEIENHIRGSHSTDDQSPGLGVLNIGVQGYAEGKNEFVSVKYKEFHPIGRLSKMNFRFERKSDRNIYDFKNINLHFLLSVKFFRPSQKTKFTRSTLNPEYDMNFMSYANNSVEYEEEVSSDEEDYEDSDYESNLNQRENMLLRHLRT